MKKIVLFMLPLIFSISALAQQLITADFPTATIAGKSSGTITIDEILNAGSIQITRPGLTVVHYTLTLKYNGDLISMTANSPELSNQMIGYIGKMGKGDKLYIEDIIITTPQGREIKLAPQIYTIE